MAKMGSKRKKKAPGVVDTVAEEELRRRRMGDYARSDDSRGSTPAPASSSGPTGLGADLAEAAHVAQRTVADRLRKLGFDIPNITLPDGTETPDPQKVKIATKAVQADQGLPITGTPDDATIAAIPDDSAPMSLTPPEPRFPTSPDDAKQMKKEGWTPGGVGQKWNPPKATSDVSVPPSSDTAPAKIPASQAELDAADRRAEAENAGRVKPITAAPPAPSSPDSRPVPTASIRAVNGVPLDSIGVVPAGDRPAKPTPPSVGHGIADFTDTPISSDASPMGVTNIEKAPAQPDSALGLQPSWYGALERFASKELDPLKPGSNKVHSDAISAGISALKSGDPWAKKALDSGLLPQGPWSQGISISAAPSVTSGGPEVKIKSIPDNETYPPAPVSNAPSSWLDTFAYELGLGGEKTPQPTTEPYVLPRGDKLDVAAPLPAAPPASPPTRLDSVTRVVPVPASDSNPSPPDLSSAGVEGNDETPSRPDVTNLGALLSGFGTSNASFPSELGGVEAAAQGIGRMDQLGAGTPAPGSNLGGAGTDAGRSSINEQSGTNFNIGASPTFGMGSGSGISSSDIGAALAAGLPSTGTGSTSVGTTGISAGDQIRQQLISQALGF